MLKPFKNFSSNIAPLKMDNVDTDQIIPARFLKATDRKGFGENLFRDMRFESDGITKKTDFVLNRTQFKKSKILLSARNFGCGSSREHAPWALLGHGIRAIVAVSFADIFKNNSGKNGLLLIELTEKEIDDIYSECVKNPIKKAKINLEKQTLTWNGRDYFFQINPFTKKCMLQGLDDIGYSLSFTKEIDKYEKKHNMKIIL